MFALFLPQLSWLPCVGCVCLCVQYCQIAGLDPALLLNMCKNCCLSINDPLTYYFWLKLLSLHYVLEAQIN